VLESNYRNNVSPAIPVTLTPRPATPTLRVTSFALPDRGLVPGDVIAPRIQIANIGAAALTSDVEVAVVASTSRDFTLGSSIVSLYTIPGGIGGMNSTPLPNASRHGRLPRDPRHNIITPNNNVATVDGGLATLPLTPPTYFLGVVNDPYNKLNLPNQPANRLEMIKVVSAVGGEPATGVVGPGAEAVVGVGDHGDAFSPHTSRDGHDPPRRPRVAITQRLEGGWVHGEHFIDT